MNPSACIPYLFALVTMLAVSAAVAEPAASRHRPTKFDRSFGREDAAMSAALHPVVAKAARSTVRVLVGGRLACLGTAVHADGFLVTKASELDPKKDLAVEFAGGLRLPAKILDRLDAYDIVLLKIDATGLTPVEWSDAPPPAPGSFLAAVSPNGEPSAIGVASVGPRSLYKPPRGILGVILREHDTTAAIIEKVYEKTAAAEAGLLAGDVIVAVDAVAVNDCDDLRHELGLHRPGDAITLKVRRNSDELERDLTLKGDHDPNAPRSPHSEDPMVLMSGRLSNHRNGFFNVFQHDLVLQPEECGGPLVDLDGRVVGLDIARSGRVETLAIPAADLKNLLADVTKGRFSLPDIGALRDELKKADLAILKAQELRQQAQYALERAKALADTVPKPREAIPAPATMPAPESMPPTPTAMPPRP
jgi:serine protease Do